VPVKALPAHVARSGRPRDRLDVATAGFERRAIVDALAESAGNRTRAARALGLTRQGPRKKMARLGLGAPMSRTGGC
jgi:transcriptional regulator with GAF, ATPase, and Fis domain